MRVTFLIYYFLEEKILNAIIIIKNKKTSFLSKTVPKKKSAKKAKFIKEGTTNEHFIYGNSMVDILAKEGAQLHQLPGDAIQAADERRIFTSLNQNMMVQIWQEHLQGNKHAPAPTSHRINATSL